MSSPHPEEPARSTGASLMRMSATTRCVLAGGASAMLWGVVLWALR
ncbi:MAG: hypothetical protein QM772_09305 [Ottowia sp.]